MIYGRAIKINEMRDETYAQMRDYKSKSRDRIENNCARKENELEKGIIILGRIGLSFWKLEMKRLTK